jgi:hypothetical protein
MDKKLHRQALALAAMLTATVLTAIAAVGGLTRWSAAAPASTSQPAPTIVQPAPASFAQEGDD